MSRYYLRTLGRLSLHEEDRKGGVVMSDAKALAALAYLADTPDGTAKRQHLARLLWPNKEVSRARACLRQSLYYLRRKTPDQVTLVRRDEERIALDRTVLQVDLREFRDALSREDWSAVLDLHGGALLGGYDVEGAEEFRHWRDSKDDGLRAGLREACRALVSAGLEEDEPDRALRGARRWVDLNPLDEEAQHALVRSLVASGDRAGAYQAYESYRSLLHDELGESPGPRLTRVLDELRALALDQGVGLETDAWPPPGAEASGEWKPEAVGAASSAEGPKEGAAEGAPPGIRRVLAGAVLVLAVLLIGAAGWRMLAQTSGNGGTESGGLEIRVEATGPGEGTAVRVIRLVGDSAQVTKPARSLGVLSPDGSREAVKLTSPSGADIGIRTVADGQVRRLQKEGADETPVAWSPDGDWLLYQIGWLEADGEYRRRYRIRKVDGSADRSIGIPAGGPPKVRYGGYGAWSPLGTGIAVVGDSAENADIWVVHPDGTDARNLTAEHAGWDVQPAYSLDGTRIAFVSDRGGNRDVWLMGASGGEPTRLTSSRWPAKHPIWLSSHTVGYFRQKDDRAEFRTVNLSSGDDRGVTEIQGRVVRTSVQGRERPPRWIDSVALPTHIRQAAPGQWIPRSVTVRDAQGEKLPMEGVPLRWSVSDTSVLDLSREDRWLRVRGTGNVILRVNAAGWRSDSVRVRSRALEVNELEPVLSEDWTQGIDSARWIPAGDPAPRVIETPGRFPVAFLNAGDENYHSGVVSRTRFQLDEGLTVEVWGRMPVNGRRFQDFFVDLRDTIPSRKSVGVVGKHAIVQLIYKAHSSSDSLAIRFPGVAPQHVPAPDSLDTWHRYTVQVDTAGWVSLLVDGRMRWRSPETIDLELLDGTHLALYGRSIGTRILHGPVKVWEGVRYRFPTDPSPW